MANTPQPLLELVGLSKAFGALVVTDDLNLSIPPGEIHAIIGPNGAGKTTLIGQIAGELKPDFGQIRFDGQDITALPAHERPHLGLARSFQITNMLPSFSVRENVAIAAQSRARRNFRFFGHVASETAFNEKAMAALETVGLEARADVAATHLSHGEKRSLELAMALALEPKLLLLDEPMAGTGREESERMIEILNSLRKQFTMVLVEHDMQAVFSLADQITVLVYGRAIATGTVEAIRTNAEVRAAYLGEEAA